MKFLLLAVIVLSTAGAIEFNCHFDYYTFDNFGRVYTCEPAITLTNFTTVEKVTGTHQPGHTDDDVEYILVFSYSIHLPVFPRGLEHFFKNLRALQFSNIFMLSISAEDLKPFPLLEYLHLYGNRITSLDGDLFSHNPRMQYFSIVSNRIEHIGHDLVTNLNELQFLNLAGNNCINKIAETRAEVEELAPQLSVLCPPLDVTTTAATTTVLPNEKCLCEDEIEELRQENQQQNKDIEQLQQSNEQLIQVNGKLFELNAATEERLLEVEKKLRELHSLP